MASKPESAVYIMSGSLKCECNEDNSHHRDINEASHRTLLQWYNVEIETKNEREREGERDKCMQNFVKCLLRESNVKHDRKRIIVCKL